MADTTVQISFGADVSAVTSGTQQVSAAIQGIGPALAGVGASLAQFGAAVSRAFARPDVSGLTTAISQAGAGSAQFVGAMSQAGGAIQKWAGQAAAAGQQSGQLAQGFAAGKAPIDAVGLSFSEYGAHAQQAASVGATLSVSFQASQSSISALNGVLQGAATALAPVIQAATGLASSWGQFLQQATPVGAALTSVSNAAQSVSGVFDEIASAIAEVSGVFASLDEALQSVSDLFSGVSTAVGSINDVVASFNGVLQSLNGLFQDAKGALDGAQVSMIAFNAAADANPVGLLVQVIQTLVGWAMKVVDWLKQIGALGDAWNAIKAGADVFVQTLKIVWDWLGIAKTAIVDLLTGHWSFDNLQGGFQNLSKDIKQTQADAQDLAKSIELIAGKAINSIGGAGVSASTDAYSSGDFKQAAGRGGHGSPAVAPTSPPPPPPPPPASQPAAAQCHQDNCAEQKTQSQQQITAATIKGIQDRATADEKADQDDLTADKENAKAKIEVIDSQEKQGVISAAEAAAQRAAVNQGVYADEQDTEQKIYDLKVAALQKEEALPGITLARKIELDQALLALQTEHEAKMEALRATANAETVKDNQAVVDAVASQWRGIADPLVSSFTNGLMQMAESAKSFAQVMRGLGQQILNDFVTKVIDPKVEAWLWGETEQLLSTQAGQAILSALGMKDVAQHILAETMKTSATAAGVSLRTGFERVGAAMSLSLGGQAALKDVTNSASQAAAGAYNAMAHIPVVGPVLGAVAAGTVFAAVMAFKGLISSAAGGFDIPSGVNPVTQLHAQEMVLPARLANPMRDMLSNFGSGQGSGASPGGGDTHNHTHNWSVTAMDGPSVEKFLRTHGDRMVKVLNERARANAGVALGYAR